MTFATYADFEAWSGRTIATSDRNWMDLLLSIASELVTDECGWHIATSRSETLRVSGSGSSVLLVPSRYVTAVTSVKYADRRLTAPIEFAASDYQWSKNGVILLDPAAYPWWLEWSLDFPTQEYGRFPAGLDDVTVDVVHGYASVPLVVRAAVCDMVATAIATTVAGIQSQQTGSVSITFDYRESVGRLKLGDAHKAMVAKYRLGDAS